MEGISYTLTQGRGKHGAHNLTTQGGDVKIYPVKSGYKNGQTLVFYFAEAAMAKLPGAERYDLTIEDEKLFFVPNEAHGYKMSRVNKAKGAGTIRVSMPAHPKHVAEYLLQRCGEYELLRMRVAGDTHYYVELKKQKREEENA